MSKVIYHKRGDKYRCNFNGKKFLASDLSALRKIIAEEIHYNLEVGKELTFSNKRLNWWRRFLGCGELIFSLRPTGRHLQRSEVFVVSEAKDVAADALETKVIEPPAVAFSESDLSEDEITKSLDQTR